MLEGITNVADFNISDTSNLVRFISRNLKGKGAIYLVGTGSSFYFPTIHAVNVARELSPSLRVESIRTKRFDPAHLAKGSVAVLISNSGDTLETIEKAKMLTGYGIPFFGITANKDSKLAAMGPSYILPGEFEKVCAATKSVISQTLYLDGMLHRLCNEKFQLGMHGEYATDVFRAMYRNLNHPIDGSSLDSIAYAQSIWWIDNELGVAAELDLKSFEIMGKETSYHPCTDALHGPGEGLIPGKQMILLGTKDYLPKNYSIDHLAAFDKLARETGTGFYTFENSNYSNFGYETIPGFEPYCLLAGGWGLLHSAALYLGRNPDVTKVAQKARTE
ncbi:MAG: SIS domain-containing protein [Candidatus Woesearchaeota archaeon]|nr:SIS domain-containing protein [Candidatus Woesearchaeota archaeon]